MFKWGCLIISVFSFLAFVFMKANDSKRRRPLSRKPYSKKRPARGGREMKELRASTIRMVLYAISLVLSFIDHDQFCLRASALWILLEFVIMSWRYTEMVYAGWYLKKARIIMEANDSKRRRPLSRKPYSKKRPARGGREMRELQISTIHLVLSVILLVLSFIDHDQFCLRVSASWIFLEFVIMSWRYTEMVYAGRTMRHLKKARIKRARIKKGPERVIT